ncbi:MAG: ATP-binding cassette domain-containing protein [Slackia sp.]|nr:ATP-binding cassette domain-containing protein [Slackia sp.]
MPEIVNTTPLSGFASLPDDADGKTMIAVENVSMIFNMANEQLNSLKEYAIALARKELRFKEFRALDDITLDIKRGDVFGILGTNGSGKSTLLKIIAGVLEPTKGTCSINGNIAPLIELGAGFDMELTARENIFLNGALLGYSKKFIQDNFDDIVEFAEVEPFLDMPLKNYSSGMVARIAFAIATVIVPDILIVDEVLSVGDFMFQKKCEERIQSLIKEHGVTVLIVSHNNDQIERLCNKAVWIEKGHMRMLGSAHDVCQTYRVLGGHTGSKEAEDRVFSMLTSPIEADESIVKPLEADSPYAMAARLSSSCREEASPTVVVAYGEYEMEGFLGTGLAGALDAPVLLTKTDGIPDVTSQEIKRLKAERVILIGKTPYCDAERFGSDLEAATDMHCEIEALSAPTYEGLSLAVFDYGAQRGLWQGPVVLTHIGCMGDMISLSPYISEQRCPLLIKSPGKPLSDAVIDRVLSADCSRLLVLDSEEGCSDEELAPFRKHGMDILRFCEDDAYRANAVIRSWIEQERAHRGYRAKSFIAAPSWQPAYSYTIGPYADKTGSLVVLDDPQNLDSVAGVLDLLESRRGEIEQIVFVGSRTQFSPLDKTLLAKAATAVS